MSAIIGLDTASNRFHWCSTVPLWDGTGDDPEPSKTGFVQFAGMEEGACRHLLMMMGKRFFEGIPPGSSVFAESPIIMMKNIETTRLLVAAATAVQLGFFLANPDAAWYWVDVMTWRKQILGRAFPPMDYPGPKARRTKMWVEEMVRGKIEFDAEFAETCGAWDDNLYDAWGLRRYGELQLS